MLILRGKNLLSPFRKKKLFTQLQSRESRIQNIEAHAVYFAAQNSLLTASEQNLLEQLTESSGWNVADHLMEQSHLVLVVPRIGTISPWSSKATDILHRVGLEKIARVEKGIAYWLTCSARFDEVRDHCLEYLFDPMVESVLFGIEDGQKLFSAVEPTPFKTIPLHQDGRAALEGANSALGLALSSDEMDYLLQSFQTLERDPTDVELMMFAQANSEHCRHKIFNASWTIDGIDQPKTLFQMIKNTHQQQPEGTLSAYTDNGAVISGYEGERFFVDPLTRQFSFHSEAIHSVIKVETHNHPTAIAPFPGAATGAGGEIRDEGATGQGAKPKAGLVGFSVSHLRIPHWIQPWETHAGKPAHIASALDIMLQAPIGSAAFNNEFGRPCLGGYFRTYEHRIEFDGAYAWRGYHKPILIAGGLGNIRPMHTQKTPLFPGAKLIVLGGAGMQIGLGGGAASSMSSGQQQSELDFASVQRSNPEMQRRCQEVIDACWALGTSNPILSIHDVGAGGLANALPELVAQAGLGGDFQLREIPSDDSSMSPLAIWCNESQERYVLAVDEKQLDLFKTIAMRECCPFSVVGETTKTAEIVVEDSHFQTRVIEMPNAILLGKPPRLHKEATRIAVSHPPVNVGALTVLEAAERVLKFPVVADKSFLITIGDRSVGGLVARDQMVGPWQVPVADVAVTASGFRSCHGEAMAMGERAPIALINAAASARMAVAEAITNMAAAAISDLKQIKLSANWMAASGQPGEDANLFDAVHAVGMELCPALELAIPVGKDSLFMNTKWQKEDGHIEQVTAPLSLIISAFAPVEDIRRTLTPDLKKTDEKTCLLFLDLAEGHQRLGASALAQILQQLGDKPADVVSPDLLKRFFVAIQTLNRENLLLAYHDRSDGGLFVTLCEMMFSGHLGIEADLTKLGTDPFSILFNEELGVVLQIRECDLQAVESCLEKVALKSHTYKIADVTDQQNLRLLWKDEILVDESRTTLQRWWSETSYQMQVLRDDPDCASEAFDAILDEEDPGLSCALSFSPEAHESMISTPKPIQRNKPRIAILREQGVNGQLEMAAAFDRAGFECIDVHVNDLLQQHVSLDDFHGVAACGGFSYGDVLGAGRGWASTILHNPYLRENFSRFFSRENTFALGICNGCQMLSQLRDLIPGSEDWPYFLRNRSEQFEARFSMVEIPASTSIFFEGMAGSKLPIVISHGEGRASWKEASHRQNIVKNKQIALKYIDNQGRENVRYPFNPNGSELNAAGVTSVDGRVTLLMPHPERVFRISQWSWQPKNWQGDDSPWMQLFRNAKRWLA